MRVWSWEAEYDMARKSTRFFAVALRMTYDGYEAHARCIEITDQQLWNSDTIAARYRYEFGEDAAYSGYIGDEV